MWGVGAEGKQHKVPIIILFQTRGQNSSCGIYSLFLFLSLSLSNPEWKHIILTDPFQVHNCNYNDNGVLYSRELLSWR